MTLKKADHHRLSGVPGFLTKNDHFTFHYCRVNHKVTCKTRPKGIHSGQCFLFKKPHNFHRYCQR
jgi:hypothetical protein